MVNNADTRRSKVEKVDGGGRIETENENKIDRTKEKENKNKNKNKRYAALLLVRYCTDKAHAPPPA